MVASLITAARHITAYKCVIFPLYENGQGSRYARRRHEAQADEHLVKANPSGQIEECIEADFGPGQRIDSPRDRNLLGIS
jgi:hypothetical protein